MCCQLAPQRQVQDFIERSEFKDLNELMPNSEICRPTFQYVKNKRQRDASMSSEGGEPKEKTAEDQLNDEVELLMAAISEKGDIASSF